MARARIVYVDDDLELTQLVQTWLENADYEVITANDGEEGLETILVEQPDIIILDVMMPGLSGWEIAKYIRSKPDWNETPILMLTGIGPAVNDMTAPVVGATDHLDKPFEFDDLVARVNQLAARLAE